MKSVKLSSQLYPGLVALVDDRDYDIVASHAWCPFKTTSHGFYAKTTVGGKFTLMHNLIRPDLNGHVDHADRNGLNNTRTNLRPATWSQQNANRLLPKLGCSSQYRGVSWEKASGKWRARITVDRKDRRLGLFASEVTAAEAYDAAALASWGEYAVLNFPSGRCPEAEDGSSVKRLGEPAHDRHYRTVRRHAVRHRRRQRRLARSGGERQPADREPEPDLRRPDRVHPRRGLQQPRSGPVQPSGTQRQLLAVLRASCARSGPRSGILGLRRQLVRLPHPRHERQHGVVHRLPREHGRHQPGGGRQRVRHHPGQRLQRRGRLARAAGAGRGPDLRHLRWAGLGSRRLPRNVTRGGKRVASRVADLMVGGPVLN